MAKFRKAGLPNRNRAFQRLSKKHPKSSRAVNAKYWIGESHYALRDFDQAIVEFDAVRSRYPGGERLPAALLKQASRLRSWEKTQTHDYFSKKLSRSTRKRRRRRRQSRN